MDDRYLNLTYRGQPLGATHDDFAPLRRSDEVLHDTDVLHARMEEDGYLFLPGLLNVDEVKAARLEVMERLNEIGALESGHPVVEGVASDKEINPAATGPFMPRMANDNPPLDRVLYEGPMIDFFTRFLGGPVRHYDYTWFRCKRPGTRQVTTPHLDVVYMGRGTKQLFTAWVPYGDVPLQMGGLMLLEDSHRNAKLKAGYGSTDVDLFCSNEGDAEAIVEAARAEGRPLTEHERKAIQWNSSGAYSDDALAVREELGGRWLTTDYEMGDLLVFSMYTLHASSDNYTNQLRISSDSRYQLSSEPVDERWIGDDPPAHGIRAKRGMVC
jgi:hypothetical protein